jgi:hypothetical protein
MIMGTGSSSSIISNSSPCPGEDISRLSSVSESNSGLISLVMYYNEMTMNILETNIMVDLK